MVGGKNSSLSDLYEVSPPKLPIELPSMVTIMIVIIFIMMTMKMMTIIAMTTMVMTMTMTLTMTMAMINSISSGTLGVWWNPCKHFRVPWVFPMLQGKLINFHTLQSFHMLQGKFELLIHLGCKVTSPGNLINWSPQGAPGILIMSISYFLILWFGHLTISLSNTSQVPWFSTPATNHLSAAIKISTPLKLHASLSLQPITDHFGILDSTFFGFLSSQP